MAELSELSEALNRIVEKRFICTECRKSFETEKEAAQHASDEHLTGALGKKDEGKD